MEIVKLDPKEMHYFEQMIHSSMAIDLFNTTLEQLGLGIFYSNSTENIFLKNSIFSSMNIDDEKNDIIVKKIQIENKENKALALLILAYKNPRKKAHTIRNALACLEGVHHLLQNQDPQALKALLDAFK